MKCFRVHFFTIFFGLILGSSVAHAEWTWNLGVHNPAASVGGVNFLHFWPNWAAEAGFGLAVKDAAPGAEDTLHLTGGFSMKYLFYEGIIRPYVQGGVSSGTGLAVGKETAGRAGLPGGYFGGGLFARTENLYVYSSYNFNTSGSQGFLQFGVGFPF